MTAHGLWAGVQVAFHQHAAQGALHDTVALLVFSARRLPSRSAALSLNMLVFLAWQLALLAVIPRVSGSRALGWIAFGLVLCVAHPWSADAASAVDFRPDHAAMCLMGLTATAALLTGGLRSVRWSLCFGLVATVTLLERFLTGVYFAGIFAALGGWILCGEARWSRLRNLALAGTVMLVLAGPGLWLNRTVIYNYYWVGHIASAEAEARAQGFGARQSVEFIAGELGRFQLGGWFLWVTATISAVLGVAALASPRTARAPARHGDWLVVSLIFMLVPAVVLGLHRQKSPLCSRGSSFPV